MPRADIHPEYHPVIFVDGDYELITRSTQTSTETRTIDGVEHFVIPIEISSNSHPFWTGQQKFIDSEGRVERFRAKYGRGGDAGKKAAAKKAAPAADESDEG